MHKGIEWAREYPEEITHPAYFAQLQAEEILKLACCAFYAPKNSVVSADYNLRISVLTEAAAVMSSFCRRNAKLRKLVNDFQDTEKLNTLWRRWQGRMDYLFYWPGGEGDWAEDLKHCLDEQMPFTMQYAVELKKEKDAQEKEAREAKFSKKKKADKPKPGEDAPDDEKKAPQTKPEPPPAPEDLFYKAVYEYNLEIFTQTGSWRKDVREVVAFKQDMAAFAQILARFRDAAKALHTQYPEGILRLKNTGSTGRNYPAARKK